MRDDTREMLMLMTRQQLQELFSAAKENLEILIEQRASEEATAQAGAAAKTYREAINLKDRE